MLHPRHPRKPRPAAIAKPDRVRFLREYREELSLLDVTPSQACVLLYVDRYPGIFIRRCARALGVTDPAIGYIIKRIEQRGWVRKQRAPHDDRYVLLTATRKGTDLVRKIRHLLDVARMMTTRNTI